MAKWIDKPGLSTGQLADDDKVLVGDVSEAVGSRDKTATLGALRTYLGAGVTAGASQTAHGFSVGDVIRHNGTIFVKATADTEPNARVVGVVTHVPDANSFLYQSTGLISGLSGLTPGTVYYLQDDGSLGTSMGTVSRPVYIAVSSTAAVLIISAGVSNTYYDLQMGFSGVPDAGAADVVIVARSVTIRAASPGAVYVGTNPNDGPATFDIQVEGVSAGTLEIGTDGSVSWAVPFDIVMTAGQRIALIAPSPADSTLADVIVAFRGEAA